MTTRPGTPAGRVTLWFSKVGEASRAAEAAVREYLSASEVDRLQGIRVDRKRREFLLSRSLMRHALAETFARPMQEWRLHEQRGAAPRPQPVLENTWLSLSHSRGIVCFAIADGPLGVDIECLDSQRDYRRSAGFFMDDGERARLESAGATRGDFFYRAWCAKEAWYKALAPAQQADTVMRAINYDDIRQGRDGRRLIEGCGDGFRFAAAVNDGELSIEQYHYLQPIQVTLEPPPGMT